MVFAGQHSALGLLLDGLRRAAFYPRVASGWPSQGSRRLPSGSLRRAAFYLRSILPSGWSSQGSILISKTAFSPESSISRSWRFSARLSRSATHPVVPDAPSCTQCTQVHLRTPGDIRHRAPLRRVYPGVNKFIECFPTRAVSRWVFPGVFSRSPGFLVYRFPEYYECFDSGFEGKPCTTS